MKTDRTRLFYAALRRRADAYQQMVQSRIDRLLREAGAKPTQLTRFANGRCYYTGPWPSDRLGKAKVLLARQLSNNRLYAAHCKLAVLVAKGRTDFKQPQPTPAPTTVELNVPGVRRRPFTFTKEISA